MDWNSCVALKNTNQWGKQDFNMLDRIDWTLEHVISWVQIYPVHAYCLEYKRVRAVEWSGVSVVRQVWIQVQVQQHKIPKESGQLTTWIYWIVRLFHQSIFSSLMASTYSKMTKAGANIESGPEPHRESLGCVGEDYIQWLDVPIVRTR